MSTFNVSLLKDWKTWALVVVAVLFVLDFSGHLLNFPLRLLMARVELYFAEAVWLRMRI